MEEDHGCRRKGETKADIICNIWCAVLALVHNESAHIFWLRQLQHSYTAALMSTLYYPFFTRWKGRPAKRLNTLELRRHQNFQMLFL